MLFFALKESLHPNKVNKVLYKLSLDEDYLLMNNVKLDLPDAKFECSHILITNKFIYVIQDKFYENNLLGQMVDRRWIVSNSDGTDKRMINNPIMVNRYRAYQLNNYLTKGQEDNLGLVVPLTVINNKISIPTSVQMDVAASKEICHLKELRKFIYAFEEQHKVGNIPAEIQTELVKFVKTFNGGMPPKKKTFSFIS